MYTLVFNCGSSSLKFALIHSKENTTELSGLAERLGDADSVVVIKWKGEKISEELKGGAHQEAINSILAFLKDENYLERIEAVGHRVVHGGEAFTQSVKINDEILKVIEQCIPLAPLHNPANLVGIQAAQKAFPTLPHVAVFDTAFHQTMPEKAYLYALPMNLYREHNVRRYGFHGTSHRFIAERAAELLKKSPDQCAIISAHLGNGASVAAILNGKSVDTSMGLTPLEGLVMGTRSGDLDPGIFQYLADRLNMSVSEINEMLNKKSGLLGLSELSNDCRTLELAVKEGHQGAKIALEVFCYRLAKTIASYLVALGRLDALVFTGGIGENSSTIRHNVLQHLAFLGFNIDQSANLNCTRGNEGVIATSLNFGKALVICTDEEGMIVRDTLSVL